ncbi:MAG: 50S ribosomal protein L6 [Cyanophyceae cyanobacterium]
MSRIGKQPVPIPSGVTVTLKGQHVTVKGPKGELQREFPAEATFEQDGDAINVNRINDSRVARQRHGLCRSLLANMVEGVSSGFQRKLEIQGVGYRAQVKGKTLNLSVGYSHPVDIPAPDGIEFSADGPTNLTVSGIDKELVGNTAARIRAVRPPEPFKGKGIRYQGEQIRRKAGKTGKK